MKKFASFALVVLALASLLPARAVVAAPPTPLFVFTLRSISPPDPGRATYDDQYRYENLDPYEKLEDAGRPHDLDGRYMTQTETKLADALNLALRTYLKNPKNHAQLVSADPTFSTSNIIDLNLNLLAPKLENGKLADSLSHYSPTSFAKAKYKQL